MSVPTLYTDPDPASTEFIEKHQKLTSFLTGARLQDVLAGPRKPRAEELLTSLFGDPWEPGYTEFVNQANELRRIGMAYVPLIAIGYRVPHLPLSAIYLVADRVLEYRRNGRPKTPSELISERMGQLRRRSR